MSARDVVLCVAGGCSRAASQGDYCHDHWEPAGHRPGFACTAALTDADYAQLRAQVAADAAPLFLLALNFLLGREVEALASEAAALEAGS